MPDQTLHSVDDEIETQTGERPCLRSPAREETKLAPEPRLYPPSWVIPQKRNCFNTNDSFASDNFAAGKKQFLILSLRLEMLRYLY